MEKVSVIVPILNEENYIQRFLDSILDQDYPRDYLEVILVDGVSGDNTVNLIETYTEKYDFIKLITNEKKTVQYALNLGIEHSSGEYIVRMDAHAWYAKDYISKCIEYLKKTGANNVGGPTVVKGYGETQKIIAAAYSSPFALGGGNHYRKDFEGYSDTVSWGCFRRDYIISLGMYDERLPRSEDDDLNFRIIKNGGKIYITSKIKSEYYPKETFCKLFKQYFNYGVWKIAVIKKHHKPLRITQLVPMAFTGFLILFSILSIFSNVCLYLFLSGIIIYLLMDFFFSFKSDGVKSFKERLLLMWAHIVIHISYGFGFWVGIFKFWNNGW